MPNLIVQITGSIGILICGYLYGKMDLPLVSLLCYGGGILWLYYNMHVFLIGKTDLKSKITAIGENIGRSKTTK